MAFSLYDAKKVVWAVSNLYDRCIETPNFYVFYSYKDDHLEQAYVSKDTGRLEESKEFNGDFYHDLWMKEYKLSEDEDRIIKDYIYCYYPDLNAVKKADGCTFFDSERGFIFDSDGDWPRKCVFGDRLPSSKISADEALAIISREEYEFLFFGKKMNDEDVEYFEKIGMPYSLKE